MPSFIGGLPVHPLSSTRRSCSVPLSVLGALSSCCSRGARRRYGSLVVITAVVATVCTVIAEETGEALRHDAPQPGGRGARAAAGSTSSYWMVAADDRRRGLRAHAPPRRPHGPAGGHPARRRRWRWPVGSGCSRSGWPWSRWCWRWHRVGGVPDRRPRRAGRRGARGRAPVPRQLAALGRDVDGVAGAGARPPQHPGQAPLHLLADRAPQRARPSSGRLPSPASRSAAASSTTSVDALGAQPLTGLLEQHADDAPQLGAGERGRRAPPRRPGQRARAAAARGPR